jgi:hypothetical protein
MEFWKGLILNLNIVAWGTVYNCNLNANYDNQPTIYKSMCTYADGATNASI